MGVPKTKENKKMEFIVLGLIVFILVEFLFIGFSINKLKKRIDNLEVWFSAYILSQKNNAVNNEKGGGSDDNKRNRKKG